MRLSLSFERRSSELTSVAVTQDSPDSQVNGRIRLSPATMSGEIKFWRIDFAQNSIRTQLVVQTLRKMRARLSRSRSAGKTSWKEARKSKSLKREQHWLKAPLLIYDRSSIESR